MTGRMSEGRAVDGGAHGGSPSLLDRPTGWLFHAVLSATLVVLLWATSTPAWLVEGWLFVLPFLGLLGIVWSSRSLVFVLRCRKHRASGNSRALLIAPCLVLGAFGLVATGVPLQARWRLSRPSFQRVVVEAPPAAIDDGWQRLGGPQRLGLYDVRAVYKVRDAVIFYEASGGFLDDSGFACLPSGPFPELESGAFESPRFEHLGGCWYTWTASW